MVLNHDFFKSKKQICVKRRFGDIMDKTFSSHFTKDDYSKIIYTEEINLGVLSEEARNSLNLRLAEYKKLFGLNLRVEINENSLVYDTEILIPAKKQQDRTNLLLVLGNPAIHSVSEGMFFSYERTRAPGRWREHRAWKAFQDCGIVKFKESDEVDIHKPDVENIKAINAYKQYCLLNTEYESAFNIFMLPYFSFPTPASGKYNGVLGIKKLFGPELFRKTEELEFQRFKNIVLTHNLKYVICFQKDSFNEIMERIETKGSRDHLTEYSNLQLYKICIGYIDDKDLHDIFLYQAPPTRRLLGKKGKEALCGIVSNITGKGRFV